MRKTAFFELFSRHSAKNMRENSVFSRSSRQFVLTKFAKNAEKQRFLRFLLDVIQKSVRKRCFFTSFETLCTNFAKNAKIAFSSDFCATIRKMCEKTVFFQVFRDTLYKIHKNAKKQNFLSFLHDVLQKVWKISVFPRFLDTFTKFAKNVKKHCFSAPRRPQKSVRKQCFSTFIETLCTKIAKNAEKQRFLSFLRDVLQKSVRKQCFSRLSRHFVWSLEECEKQRFLRFLRDDPQEVWEKSVFSRFSRHFVQISHKCDKTTFL